MRYETSSAFRAALEQRFLTNAQRSGLSVMRLRKMVVFDRLLARLLVAAPDRWLLKGALALDFRFGNQARTTRDIDIARQDTIEQATIDFIRVQTADLHDYFQFVIERDRRLDAAEHSTVRFHVSAELAGRPFDSIVVDVAFGDVVLQPIEMLPGTDLLGFAGIDQIDVPAISIVQHVAEKVHAYTRTFSGQHPSTRVKDLVDLLLIQSLTSIGAIELRAALQATFDHRRTHQLPELLPPPPMNWRVSYRRLASEVGLDPGLLAGYGDVATFLNPVLT